LRGADVLRAVDFAGRFAVFILAAGLRFVAVVAMLAPLLGRQITCNTERESRPIRSIKGVEAMQRDMDYVRELLLKIEAEPVSIETSTDLLPTAASDEDLQRLNYHLGMLIDEAGFIKAIEACRMSGG
jgi:hypothetical protein